MEFITYRLGDILDNYDYLRKPLSSMERENFQGEYPYYGAQGIIDYVKEYRCDGEYMLIAEDGENLNSRNQPIAQIANGKYWVNNHAHVVRTNELANMVFTCHALNLMDIAGYVTGAAQPKLSQGSLNKIKISFPPREYQDKVAEFISLYDKLIENNTKRIKLLEQMAENLYKEWFVRFRFPGHEDTEFEGGMPKGWNVVHMSDFCYVTDGTHDSPKETEVGYPLVTGKGIVDGFIDFKQTYNISEADHLKIKKRSGLQDGVILFSNIGTVGNSCIVKYDREFSVKNVIIFKPDSMEKTAYLYYWMNSETMQSIFSVQTNGASQQFVGLTFMRKYKILVPTEEIIDNFAKIVLPIIKQKELIHEKNENLIKQRDLLLPRLMSGKLEVK